MFAAYRERVGKAELYIELPEGANVATLANAMSAQYPMLTDNPKSLVVAVNHEYSNHDHSLEDGDEAAFIPPVSGGSL